MLINHPTVGATRGLTLRVRSKFKKKDNIKKIVIFFFSFFFLAKKFVKRTVGYGISYTVAYVIIQN